MIKRDLDALRETKKDYDILKGIKREKEGVRDINRDYDRL